MTIWVNKKIPVPTKGRDFCIAIQKTPAVPPSFLPTESEDTCGSLEPTYNGA